MQEFNFRKQDATSRKNATGSNKSKVSSDSAGAQLSNVPGVQPPPKFESKSVSIRGDNKKSPAKTMIDMSSARQNQINSLPRHTAGTGGLIASIANNQQQADNDDEDVDDNNNNNDDALNTLKRKVYITPKLNKNEVIIRNSSQSQVQEPLIRSSDQELTKMLNELSQKGENNTQSSSARRPENHQYPRNSLLNFNQPLKKQRPSMRNLFNSNRNASQTTPPNLVHEPDRTQSLDPCPTPTPEAATTIKKNLSQVTNISSSSSRSSSISENSEQSVRKFATLSEKRQRIVNDLLTLNQIENDQKMKILERERELKIQNMKLNDALIVRKSLANFNPMSGYDKHNQIINSQLNRDDVNNRIEIYQKSNTDSSNLIPIMRENIPLRFPSIVTKYDRPQSLRGVPNRHVDLYLQTTENIVDKGGRVLSSNDAFQFIGETTVNKINLSPKVIYAHQEPIPTAIHESPRVRSAASRNSYVISVNNNKYEIVSDGQMSSDQIDSIIKIVRETELNINRQKQQMNINELNTTNNFYIDGRLVRKINSPITVKSSRNDNIVNITDRDSVKVLKPSFTIPESSYRNYLLKKNNISLNNESEVLPNKRNLYTKNEGIRNSSVKIKNFEEKLKNISDSMPSRRSRARKTDVDIDKLEKQIYEELFYKKVSRSPSQVRNFDEKSGYSSDATSESRELAEAIAKRIVDKLSDSDNEPQYSSSIKGSVNKLKNFKKKFRHVSHDTLPAESNIKHVNNENNIQQRHADDTNKKAEVKKGKNSDGKVINISITIPSTQETTKQTNKASSEENLKHAIVNNSSSNNFLNYEDKYKSVSTTIPVTYSDYDYNEPIKNGSNKAVNFEEKPMYHTYGSDKIPFNYTDNIKTYNSNSFDQQKFLNMYERHESSLKNTSNTTVNNEEMYKYAVQPLTNESSSAYPLKKYSDYSSLNSNGTLEKYDPFYTKAAYALSENNINQLYSIYHGSYDAFNTQGETLKKLAKFIDGIVASENKAKSYSYNYNNTNNNNQVKYSIQSNYKTNSSDFSALNKFGKLL